MPPGPPGVKDRRTLCARVLAPDLEAGLGGRHDPINASTPTTAKRPGHATNCRASSRQWRARGIGSSRPSEPWLGRPARRRRRRERPGQWPRHERAPMTGRHDAQRVKADSRRQGHRVPRDAAARRKVSYPMAIDQTDRTVVTSTRRRGGRRERPSRTGATSLRAWMPRLRTRLGSSLPSALRSIGLVLLAMVAILVILPAALVAAGT
jgi:hypothetical protein